MEVLLFAASCFPDCRMRLQTRWTSRPTESPVTSKGWAELSAGRSLKPPSWPVLQLWLRWSESQEKHWKTKSTIRDFLSENLFFSLYFNCLTFPAQDQSCSALRAGARRRHADHRSSSPRPGKIQSTTTHSDTLLDLELEFYRNIRITNKNTTEE